MQRMCGFSYFFAKRQFRGFLLAGQELKCGETMTSAWKEIGQRPISERLLSTTNKMADADESFPVRVDVFGFHLILPSRLYW